MANVLYVGPSWANRSYDTPQGTETNYTNLVKELDLSVVDLTGPNNTNQYFLDKLDKNRPNSYDKKFDAIIWVYCEPILDADDQKSLIQSEKFWEIRKEINQSQLKRINDIGVPVAIIGAHSDVVNCNYSNISVIHPSWQKFLAEYSGTSLEHGWGCEVGHRFIVDKFPDAKPSKSVVNYVSDTWGVWCKLDLNRVFCWCHPNRFGTELFANEIKFNLLAWMKNL